jgi:hypothetical protein
MHDSGALALSDGCLVPLISEKVQNQLARSELPRRKGSQYQRASCVHERTRAEHLLESPLALITALSAKLLYAAGHRRTWKSGKLGIPCTALPQAYQAPELCSPGGDLATARYSGAYRRIC